MSKPVLRRGQSMGGAAVADATLTRACLMESSSAWCFLYPRKPEKNRLIFLSELQFCLDYYKEQEIQLVPMNGKPKCATEPCWNYFGVEGADLILKHLKNR